MDCLRRALDEYEVSGITTTLPFFREVVKDEEFISGQLDTGFIARFNQRHAPDEPSQVESDLAAIAAALNYSKRQQQASMQIAMKTAPSRWRRS
jgi:propionyl-CoA carboxylase alpha chain